jgi:hypothetical protein
MMKKRLSRPTRKIGQLHKRSFYLLALGSVLIVFLMLGLAACQPESDGEEPAVDEVAPQGQAESSTTESSESSPETAGETAAETAAKTAAETAADEPVTETEASQPPPDPDALWASSSHASTFVMDDDGTNIKCARCHAPIQWVPTMDDIPESCLTCKFELEPPPPVVAEAEWDHVPCQVCHKVKKDEVKPEYMWLEIAQIEEYAEVASTTELCLKCHEAVDVPGHEELLFTDVHQDLTCTECHDAHGTTSGCSKPGCHVDALNPAEPIAGHDEDHALISCVACHDAAGLEVGPVEESGMWITFAAGESAETAESLVSHELQLEVKCERCHYSGNPWGLSEAVSSGS